MKKEKKKKEKNGKKWKKKFKKKEPPQEKRPHLEDSDCGGVTSSSTYGKLAHKRHRAGPARASTRIMASCHVWRSWMAWQLIRRLCPPLYRRYGPDLDLPGGFANPFDVFEALLTYKNYEWGHFVTFVVWMTSHYSAGCCWRCYRQMRKAYPWAIPTWHALLRRRLGLFLLRP